MKLLNNSQIREWYLITKHGLNKDLSPFFRGSVSVNVILIIKKFNFALRWLSIEVKLSLDFVFDVEGVFWQTSQLVMVNNYEDREMVSMAFDFGGFKMGALEEELSEAQQS
jgi:hypothetical protein